MLLLIVLVVTVLSLLVVLAWLRVKTAAGSTLTDVTGRILLITAHPDDECMFFAPTALYLGRSVRAELFLMCLSEGMCVCKHAIYMEFVHPILGKYILQLPFNPYLNIASPTACATGNYHGEGRVRKKELLHSSAILGISGTHVEIVNDT